MELTWEWRGYCVAVKLARERQARREARQAEERIVEPSAAHYCPEKTHVDLLHASGSRYVGPIR